METEALAQAIRDRLERLAMTGKVTASPEAKRFLAREESTDGNYEEEIDYLAEHALAVARAIAEGSTGEHGVRVSITTRIEIPDEEGEIDILAVETEVDADGGRFWISLE